ncbi:MAG: bifunctional phosphopantothenoylcysteine decarboxylase/phosphopantothenate--cysteine ligase CoaBC [Gammaproteobacteria bacterium]|nr:bifunctional phosphopantothenoylcysteine decarboxylase/phosphopantothenate--cysteine ligase CoaBC [Gammaproteobacteria bacterium]
MSATSPPTLAGRRILLGVSGGIAAYKSPDLVRRLRERGAEVQVVMTPGAQRFVTPTTFQAVSGREVRAELWDAAAEASMGHIELARWADLALVAPATADFLARVAAGRADDLLTTLILATESPVALAPTMNRIMWDKPVTQHNVATLRRHGVHLLGPEVGSQGCGKIGSGRMLEPAEIAEAASTLLADRPPRAVTLRVVAAAKDEPRPLAGLSVLITAGPTREPIDPVRYITNRSSGKMGFAVAAAAHAAGAEVVLVAGPVSSPTPEGVRRIDDETATEMASAVEREATGLDVLVGTAPVADYRPATRSSRKLKKTMERIDLPLERTADILAAVAARADRPFVVGFAAETHDVEQYARSKLLANKLDLIAANEVGEGKVFDRDDNTLVLLWANGWLELGPASKDEVARRLLEIIGWRLADSRARGAHNLGSAGAEA